MIEPKTPKNEQERQRAVLKYNLLDSLPEESYNNITELMCYITNSPISLITLLDQDRNYILSNCGFPKSESPRIISFCGHAIQSEEPIMIVEDARKDERFHDNPLVSEHKAIFYAGVPLINPDGFKLGTLCVYDHEPRQLDEAQRKALIAMAKQVVNLFEQRLQNSELRSIKAKLEKRNEDLNKFVGIVSHDLKSPLANIISLTELLESENKSNLNEESLNYLEYLKQSSIELKDYIDGLLEYYKSDELFEHKIVKINTRDFISQISNVVIPKNKNVSLTIESHVETLQINKSALQQILINLITNAIKYNDKEKPTIIINLSEDNSTYFFRIKDNGIGIPQEKLDSIFDLFTIVGNKDSDGNIGTGIGLASVKRIIEHLGGAITVSSIMSEGSIFSFNIPKY